MRGPSDAVDLSSRKPTRDPAERVGVSPRYEEPVATGRNVFGDRDDLVWRLALAEDDFRVALPERPMMIDSCKPKRFDGIPSESVQRRIRIDLAIRDLAQQRQHTVADHASAGSRSAASPL
jgi:hypothetical protein